MPSTPHLEARFAWNSVVRCGHLIDNELEDYEQEHGEGASEVATADLHDHNYKQLRFIDDYLNNAVCFSLFSFS